MRRSYDFTFFVLVVETVEYLLFSWDLPVTERLLTIWNDITKLVKYWEALPKAKRPSSKSYMNVKMAVADDLIPAELKFFCFIAEIVKPYLTKYQTDKSMVPYLYHDIVRIIRRLMQLIVKPEILDKCSTFLDFKGVDLDNKNTMVKPKNMNIGFGARSVLTEFGRKDKVKSSDLAELFTNAVLFIVTIIKKLLEKSPAGSSVVKNTSFFDPRVLASEKSELLHRKMSALLVVYNGVFWRTLGRAH